MNEILWNTFIFCPYNIMLWNIYLWDQVHNLRLERTLLTVSYWGFWLATEWRVLCPLQWVMRRYQQYYDRVKFLSSPSIRAWSSCQLQGNLNKLSTPHVAISAILRSTHRANEFLIKQNCYLISGANTRQAPTHHLLSSFVTFGGR